MDVTAVWSRSEGVEALVERVASLTQELQKACFAKWGRAKREIVDAYASSDTVDLMRKSELWRDASAEPQEGAGLRFNKPVGVLVADFSLFQLHVHPIMSPDIIRIEAVFGIETGSSKSWYGDLKIVD